MGCCRGRQSRFPSTPVRRTSAICSNCRKSLKDEIKSAIDTRSKVIRSRGSFHFIAEIQCVCGWMNKIPVSFSKR